MDNLNYFFNNLISIITPAYNSALYISETINSVLKQTYSQWELIIVDDCSTDDTVNLVKKYQELDNRIHLIRLNHNQGVASARNIGIGYAKGRYLAFLDSDDIWLDRKLEKQINFMQSQNIGFSFTQYRQFKDIPSKSKKMIDVPGIVDYQSLLKGNMIGCLTVIIDRTLIPIIHIPQERHEDYITWLKILKQGYRAYGLKQDLARYRLSAKSISGNKKKSILWTWNIYRNIERLSICHSVYYFTHYLWNALKKHYF